MLDVRIMFGMIRDDWERLLARTSQLCKKHGDGCCDSDGDRISVALERQKPDTHIAPPPDT